MKIVKRDGRIVDFDGDKIFNAINKAANETEIGVDYELARDIADTIEDEVKELDFVPDVEYIQDMVEDCLMQSDRRDVAKKYILYRDERNRLREQGWEMTDLQRDIYEKKYRFENETFDEFLDRVSGGNDYIRKAIRDKSFIPAGRILAGRGLDKKGRKVTLSNCYVLPKVEDNIESIFDTAKHLARTYSYGGGVGFQISNLRPRGAKVNNAALTTTGSVSFMELYSMVTGLIGMRGRRGALMLNMDVSHPDIEEFVDIKNDLDKVTKANISINITDDFMNAVKSDSDYELWFKVESTGEEIRKRVRARELFEKIAVSNWRMAEPGVLFSNRINTWHLMSEDKTFEFAGVNPCAEETLPAFGSCNLSSINLGAFVKNPFTKNAEFDFEEFSEMVRHGVVYLNEVLDENMNLHPLEQQRDVSRDLRQIGLGVMGFADMLIKMGIVYGSQESIDIIHLIGEVLVNSALQQSALLAKEYGVYPRYNKDAVMSSPFFVQNANSYTKELVKKYGLRNSQILTIPPTGSVSTLVGCNNSIEPLFQISYKRKTESLHSDDTYYKVFAPIAKEYMEIYDIIDEKDLPDFFITTSDIKYKNRIDVQSAWQEYIDAAISSTLNLPEETTVEEIMDLYMYAWEKGLKGITVYRDNCLRSGILITDKSKQTTSSKIDELQAQIDELIIKSLKDNPDVCPMCGGKMVHSGGCSECQDCAYSPCSV